MSPSISKERFAPGGRGATCLIFVVGSLPRRHYARCMGRSGMKRKGRRHLPKVGSPANIDYEIHERRKDALHPFSSDPDARRGPSSTVVAIGVFLIVVIAVIALIALTA
jgi:hypothetical protein